MTLAHFGFGKHGEVLEGADLPFGLTEGWSEDEGNEGQPFPSYARLLPARGTSAAESRFSWTVDFAARRTQAREDMKPHITDAERAQAEAVSLKERLRALKAADPNDKKIGMLETRIRALERMFREAQAKADSIDAAVFDLKAVNPNLVIETDGRTPDEVIRSIGYQGAIVVKALEALRVLLQE